MDVFGYVNVFSASLVLVRIPMTSNLFEPPGLLC